MMTRSLGFYNLYAVNVLYAVFFKTKKICGCLMDQK